MHGEHILQLFDSTESREDSVAGFLMDGLGRGENLLVLAASAHWRLVSGRLRLGCPVDAALADGRIAFRDAHEILAACVRGDRVHPGQFEAALAPEVARMARLPGAGLRIYGELVDLVSADGNFKAAEELEALWNALAERHTFTLLCGYSATHFGPERAMDPLRAIRRAHTRAHAGASDLLGAWLLETADGSQPGQTPA